MKLTEILQYWPSDEEAMHRRADGQRLRFLGFDKDNQPVFEVRHASA